MRIRLLKNLLHVAVLLFVLGTNQPAQAGSVVRLYYDNLSTSSSIDSVRNGVASLTNAARFPDAPSFREQLDDFSALPGSPLRAGLQGKDNSGTDFGSWIRGYVEAPTTGEYVFGIASDDNSSLYLSTDYTEDNKRLIAFESSSGSTLFGGARLAERNSAPINLVRGQKYYFEVLHKQGGGTSYVIVGWQRPDGVQEIIPALHLAQYPVDPYLGTGSISQPPVFNSRGFNGGDLPTNSVSVAEGDELLLQLDVIAAQPTTFQWTQNDVVIPGENLSFFRLARTPGTFNGARIQATIRNASGSLTSAPVTVNVTADTTPPSILSADTGGNPNLLQVKFSEPVDSATGTNLANFEIRPAGGSPVTIQSAALLPGEQSVQLAGVFNFQAAVNYQLTVRDIRDLASTPNTLSPNPATTSFTFSAPAGTTYNFNSGLPAGFRLYGNAGVITNGSYDGSGYLELTSPTKNKNGAVLLSERHNVDQVRLRFKARISDGSSASGLEEPGDGFSINIAGDLPLGTLTLPEEGFTPNVPGNRISFNFDTHRDSSLDDPSIAVLINNQVITNVITGTNGTPSPAGIPSILSTDGRWVDVDIDLRRNGQLTLRYDGVTVIDHLDTPFDVIDNAQILFAARTRSWYQTHWIDDLNVNYGEGDIGNVGISPDSVLGGNFPEGSEVRLAVLPTGAGPFRYQWFKSNTPLTGETNRVLRFPALLGADGIFSVNVRNDFSETNSAPGNVTIQPDSTPPQVLIVRGLAGGVDQILLTFDEPLDPASATDAATYSSPLLRVSSVSLSGDGRSLILRTTPQRVGVTYPLTITGLKDRSASGNGLTTSLTFLSSITYKDEVLADNPTRYFRFDETAGTVAFSDTALSDLTLTNGAYLNLPVLGVPSLVPSETNSFAALFVGANTNYVLVPNGGDINDFRGPWSQKTVEFWFRANSTPAPGSSALYASTAGLYEEGGGARSIHLHLWRDPAQQDPAEAELILHSFNNTADGPGTPYGILQYPAVYTQYTIRTNTTYHVIGVYDGRTASLDGELRLYINGDLVGRTTNGIGQIYNHNGDVRIGSGNARYLLNQSGDFGPFDGVIDDLSLYNTVLSDERIREHYLAGVGANLTATNPPTVISGVDTRGNPNQLSVAFNQPVSTQTATSLANYTLKTAGGATIAIQSAVLLDDLVTIRLTGGFNFQSGASYSVSVQNVADILDPANVVEPKTVAFTFGSAGPVGIDVSSDLGNKQVTENSVVQFSVIASGEAPYSFQWSFKGTPLPNQTNATLEFTAALSAAGTYTVTVSNEFSSVTSPPAILTVQPDTVVPGLVEVRGLAGTLNQVRLSFSEPVEPASATNLSAYSLSGLTVLDATVANNGLEVTLQTSTQVNGQTYPVTVTGLRDRAAAPNTLTTSATFVSAASYRDEVLAEGAVRYWPFNETSGTEFNTLISLVDTSRESLVGTLANSPILSVPSLVPNLPDDTAIGFNGATTNRIDLPNGRDINAILGPWSKRTYLFYFKAGKLPRLEGTNWIQSPVIYAESRVALYLYGTQDTENPSEALLVFHAHNNASEGPGTPWGAITGNAEGAKFVTVPIRSGQAYHVAAVLDGDASGFTGSLRLYVNGQSVGSIGGVGQLFKHPTQPTFGHTRGFLRHDGTNLSFLPPIVAPNVYAKDILDGVIDEFSIINRALPATRIAELYNFAETPPPIATSAPRISDTRIQEGNIVITWEGSGKLEWADSVNGPFVPVSGAGSPYSEPIGNSGRRFFRLVP